MEYKILWRWFLSALLLLLLALWLWSLAPLYLAPAPRAQENIRLQNVNAPAWNDTLVLDVQLADWQGQLRRGFFSWTQGARSVRYPLAMQATNFPQRLIVPLGGLENWNAPAQNLRVQFLPPDAFNPQVRGAALMQRGGFPLDLILLRALSPILINTSPFPHILIFIAAIFSLALALLIPISTLAARLKIAALVLLCSVGLITLAISYNNAQLAASAYMPDPVQAQISVPAYNESPYLNATLAEAYSELPLQPILLLDTPPNSYLADRARYLFYPRRVDVASRATISNPSNVLGTSLQSPISTYGAILQSPASPPPPNGWTKISADKRPIAIYRAPNFTPPSLPAPPNSFAWLQIGGALLIAGFAGWSIAGALGFRSGLQISAALLYGLMLLAAWMFVLNLLKIAWTGWTIGIPLLIVSVLLNARDFFACRGCAAQSHVISSGVRCNHRTPLEMTNPFPPNERFFLALGIIVVVLLVWNIVQQATHLPFGDLDTWRMWGLRGRAFFMDDNLETVLRTYGSLHTPSYPPLQPLAQTWLYLAMNALDERYVKILFPLFYLSTLNLVYFTVAAWTTRTRAMFWTLLLALTPVFLDHATLGNADLPLAAMLLLGAIALCRWIESGARNELIAATLALGGAAWTKFDGAYFGVVMLMLATVIRARRLERKNTREILRDGAFAMLGFILIVAVWNVYTRVYLGLSEPTTFSGAWGIERVGTFLRGVQEFGEEIFFSHSNSAWGWLGGGYGAFWFIVIGALLWQWRKLFTDPLITFLLLTCFFGLVFYLAIYTVRPFFSSERYLLHLAPLLVLAAARAMSLRDPPPARA